MSPHAPAVSEWRETRLGELLREPIKNGYSPVCPSEPTGKWILHLGAVTDNGFNPKALKPAPSDDPKVDAALLMPGDVVVSRSNTRERVGFAGLYRGTPSPCAYPDLLMRVRPGAELEPEFLLYALLSPKGRRYFEQSARGTSGSMVKIDRAILENFPLLLPTLPEQRQIATILSSVDDTIEKTQAVIDQLEVVKKGLLGELLTRGMPGRHESFQETEIGLLPVAWSVVQVGGVCERMFVGIAQAATHAYVPSGGVPIVRTTNLRPNRLDTSELLHISDTFAKEMASKQLRTGDVLTARTGYPGTSAVVPPDLHGSQCFTLLVSRPGRRILGTFLAHLMNSHVGERIVSKGQAGGAQQNLNVSVFSAASIPLPSIEEQAAIVSVMDSTQQRTATEQHYLQGLIELKRSLLEAFLSGSIRVTASAQEAA